MLLSLNNSEQQELAQLLQRQMTHLWTDISFRVRLLFVIPVSFTLTSLVFLNAVLYYTMSAPNVYRMIILFLVVFLVNPPTASAALHPPSMRALQSSCEGR